MDPLTTFLSGTTGFIILIVLIVFIVWNIFWFFVPFLIYKISDDLKKIIALLEEQNRNLPGAKERREKLIINQKLHDKSKKKEVRVILAVILGLTIIVVILILIIK